MGIRDEGHPRAQLIFTMMLFGTIGTLSRFIDMPSSIICLGRAFFGVLIILAILALRGERPDAEAIKRNIGWLCLSSVLMCFNWICQFEAYRYTTIATATLCYYMQPVFYILAGAAVLKEKLSPRKLACVAVAFGGMVLVSGVLEPGATVGVTLEGVAFGLGAACFYAAVMILNQFLGEVDPLSKTVVQLGVAGLALLPQLLLSGEAGWLSLSPQAWVLLLVMCLVHTGLAFILWFSSLHELPAQKVAIFNYIDPAVALLVSALVFGERLTPLAVVGAVLILGSTLASELLEMRAQ